MKGPSTRTKPMRALERAILEAVGTDTKSRGVDINVKKRAGVITITVPTGLCEKCGCTDLDCGGCIARTGNPCSWANAEHTLCSACTKPKQTIHKGGLRAARGGA